MIFAIGNNLTGMKYTGKWIETYAYFQERDCQICGKSEKNRIC